MAVSSARWLVWRVPGRISDMFLLEGERGVSGVRMGEFGMGGKGGRTNLLSPGPKYTPTPAKAPALPLPRELPSVWMRMGSV